MNVCLVLTGSCEERRGGETYRHVGPSLTVNLPSSGHGYRIGPDGARTFSVRVPDAWLRDFTGERGRGPEPLVADRDPRLVVSALGIRRELLRADDVSVLTVESLLLDALARIADRAEAGEEPGRRVGDPPGWLRRVRERLDEALFDAPTLDELAREAGVHRVHVARTFKRYQGVTVGEYLRRRRVERALTQIANGSDPLGRVALRSGFYDQPHLNRTFREEVGVTPGRFRRMVARG